MEVSQPDTSLALTIYKCSSQLGPGVWDARLFENYFYQEVGISSIVCFMNLAD